MNDGLLSQEEINALLNADEGPPPSAAAALTSKEIDTIGEIGNISMGSAATTLSILLGNRVSITTPSVTITKMETVRNEYPTPYLVIEVQYTQGVQQGTNIFAIKERDALIIADLMMGNDGTNPPTEISELYMSAVSEAMNQMMGATATAMSTMFKEKFDISPPKVSLIDFAQKDNVENMAAGAPDPLVKVAFRMEVGSLIDSEMMQLMSVDVAKRLVERLMQRSQAAAAPPAAPPKQAASAPAAPPPPAQPAYAPPKPSGAPVASVPVQQVQFAPLQPQNMPALAGNIGLLMDVPMQVTVELGRTKKLIREILDLGPGSVVELDKLAGEPIDVYVNTKLIAKGEVVVIDENFGIRITEIVNPLELVNNLQ
ncbi:MAG: flagellar motor switch phosphatase FliY [Acidaminococcales bacterium]|nr:flagellar motor switch phosphatase FliY [Acidaminococcales bacterium]